jgi:hypothetical protein
VANQNFKVKKGLEVGTGVTISDGNINISGIITAQFKGDGSALTGVTAAGSGVVVQEEGSNIGTAATINFIGSSVTAALSGGIANVTVTGGGDVVSDTTPQLGGNLDLNSKNITGTGNISITGGFNATGVSTFQENVNFTSTASFGDNDKINVGTSNDLQIFHDGTSNIISDAVGAGISLVGNTKVVGVLTATSFSGPLATTDLTGTITNAQLANDSVSFGGVSVDLGSSDATPAFDLSDATNYPTSSLSGTITNAQLTGSIADDKLASTFLKNVVEDTTPQLGGNLDVNGKDTTGTGNINLTGIVTATSFSGSGSALTGLTGASAGTYGASTNTPIITVDSNGRVTGIATVATSGAGGGGGISNIVEDTTPQLGGNLDLNSKSITGTGNIEITGYAGVSGVSTFSGAVGFATHIHDAGTGGLDIRTNLLRIKNDADSETLATFAEDGAVSLYHNNTLKFNTTNDGAVVTGILTATSLVKSGGTSSQFLKADGSVDTSTYLTSETDPVVGAINGIVKANGSGTISAAVAGTDYLTPTGDGSGLTGVAGTSVSNVQVNFDVTASGSSAYRFTGPGNDAADDNPDLYLIRGQRYRFTNNSGGSHPFQIRSSPDGSAYSTGVINNGGASGNIDFNVQHDAPARLYYQCTSHSAMVGNIYIVGGSDWRMTSVNTSTAPEIYTTRNVGIGTDNPSFNLHVSSDSNTALGVYSTQTTGDQFQVATLKLRTYETSSNTAAVGDFLLTGKNTITFGGANRFIMRGDTGVSLGFYTDNTERVRIDSDGKVLVGTETNVDDYLFQVDSSAFRTAQFTRYTSDGATVVIGSSRGTQSSRTALNINDYGGLIEFKAYEGSDFSSLGRISGQCEAAAAVGDTPGRLVFWTTADNASSPTERMRITSGGEVQIANGNLKFSTAGTGIDFSATGNSSGTTTSELLDDYEEGTWSPIFSTNTGGASSQTYQVQRGRYTKIGRIVNCTFDVQLSNKGTFSGNYVTIGGLPYTNMEGGNVGGTMTIGYHSGFTLPTGGTTLTSYNDGTNVYIITPSDASGNDYLTVADSATAFNSTARLIGQITLFLPS